jgi:Protein of unknown function (DUF3501)
MTGRKLTPDDIVDLRAYERERERVREEIMALKSVRRVAIGSLITVVFENRDTVRFQIQEMARAERMLGDEQIQAELDAYNPLIPAPGELSLTMFIELTSPAALGEWLPKLVGIERSVVLAVGDQVVRGHPEAAHEVFLTREETTASVHYVTISLSPEQVEGFARLPLSIGLDHPAYRHAAPLDEATRAALLADLAGEA